MVHSFSLEAVSRSGVEREDNLEMSQWKIRRARFSLSCSHLVIVTETIWLFNGLCFKKQQS